MFKKTKDKILLTVTVKTVTYQDLESGQKLYDIFKSLLKKG